jgi:ABC-type amino acid transport substrate-binding protein
MGRHDAFCFTSYRWVPSARVNEYTAPLFYSATYAYVRADDTRFDNNLAAINDPAIHVATIDGEAAAFIKAQDYPLATAYSMPQNTDVSFLLQAVVDKKADVTFMNPLVVMGYLESHPNVLKRVVVEEPIQINSHSFAFAKGEHDLLSMFDVVLDELHQDGTMDRILDKYESIPNSFVRVKRVLP